MIFDVSYAKHNISQYKQIIPLKTKIYIQIEKNEVYINDYPEQRSTIKKITENVDKILKFSNQLHSGRLKSLSSALKRIKFQFDNKFYHYGIWRRIIFFFFMLGQKYVDKLDLQIERLEKLKAEAKIQEKKIIFETNEKYRQLEEIAMKGPVDPKDLVDFESLDSDFLLRQSIDTLETPKEKDKQLMIYALKFYQQQANHFSNIKEICVYVFGDQSFKNKKLGFIKNSEGMTASRAIYVFFTSLVNYYRSKLEILSPTEKAGLIQMIKAYPTFQLSALLRERTVDKHDMMPKEKWNALNRELMVKNIKDVRNGIQKRCYWSVGSHKHSTVFRFEKLSSGREVMSTFNLGEGMTDTQLKVSFNAKEGFSESIIHQDHYNTFAKIETLCEKIINAYSTDGTSLKKLTKEISNPSQDNDDAPPLVIDESELLTQKIQQIGDCTCRNQWALLKKEFHRLFPKDSQISYRGFKEFMEAELLNRLEPEVESPEDLDFMKKSQDDMISVKDVYDICMKKHKKLAASKKQSQMTPTI